MQLHYENAWEEGVDRWFGQLLKADQLSLIRRYYVVTELEDIPMWAVGLHFVTTDRELERDMHCLWDYGLSMDCALLCHHRRGRIPFHFHPHLWDILEARRLAFLRRRTMSESVSSMD